MTAPEPHATHREIELLETLRSVGGSARTSMLAEALKVSEETVRRTVRALADAGLVQRVHGGVYLSSTEATAPIVSRLEKRSGEKALIAAAAAAHVPNGGSVFLDVGSTTLYVAQALRRHRELTVVTNGLPAAQALANLNGNRVFLAGGALGHVENGTFGPDTLAFVERFNIDTAVLSIDGFDPAAGFLLTGSAEADLARKVAARARRAIVVADSVKFGQSAPIVAADVADIDLVVTDKALPARVTDRLAAWDIALEVAAPGAA